MEERFDYALFTRDRYMHNAMLTREEAAEHERQGMRCVDVEAAMDPSLPRFRDKITVASRGRPSSQWWGR